MKTVQYDAILPAGGRIRGDFARAMGTDVKALIRLNDQTLLARIISELRRSGCVRHIVAIGPASVRAEAISCGADGGMEEGASGPENILRGLDWLEAQKGGASTQVLVITTDQPFFTSEDLCSFLDRCPLEAEAAVPLVTRQAFEARFPGFASAFTSLHDGEFSLGGAMRFDADLLRRSRARWEALFHARKSPLQMARVIGPRVAWRYLTRQLTVKDLVARVEAEMGCHVAAVRDAPAGLAYDIDLPEEYAYALHCLAENS